MSGIEITGVLALPDDVLQVNGKLGQQALIAYGWQSALTNHYDESSLDKDGHRKEGAAPREMTKTEKRAYCENLLAAVVASQPLELKI